MFPTPIQQTSRFTQISYKVALRFFDDGGIKYTEPGDIRVAVAERLVQGDLGGVHRHRTKILEPCLECLGRVRWLQGHRSRLVAGLDHRLGALGQRQRNPRQRALDIQASSGATGSAAPPQGGLIINFHLPHPRGSTFTQA